MNPNGTTANPPADEVLELNEEGQRILADMRWVRRQRLLGNLAAYGGEWVGVFEEQVVGHNRNLIELRNEAEREQGIGRNRLVTAFVPDAKGAGVGRMWLA